MKTISVAVFHVVSRLVFSVRRYPMTICSFLNIYAWQDCKETRTPDRLQCRNYVHSPCSSATVTVFLNIRQIISSLISQFPILAAHQFYPSCFCPIPHIWKSSLYNIWINVITYLGHTIHWFNKDYMSFISAYLRTETTCHIYKMSVRGFQSIPLDILNIAF
jgi:hypothetical protein